MVQERKVFCPFRDYGSNPLPRNEFFGKTHYYIYFLIYTKKKGSLINTVDVTIRRPGYFMWPYVRVKE